MSRKWYVRDRGRVIGPFSSEQLFDLRDRGQLQGYHEVSVDQRTWKSFDLTFPSQSGAPARQSSAPAPSRPRPDMSRSTPRGGSGGPNRSYLIIVASAVGILVVSGMVVGGYLLFRGGKPKPDQEEVPGATPHGAILFTNQSAEEQDRVLRDTVGLVVTGLHVTFPDGRVWEVPSFCTDVENKRRTIKFGNPKDLIIEKFPNFFSVPPAQRGAMLRSAPQFDITEFGTGSGFIVSPTGHFLTNQHVVHDIDAYERARNRKEIEADFGVKLEPRVWVFFGQGHKYVAKILHVSDEYDVAVLKLERPCTHFFALCETPPTEIPSTLKNLSAVGFPGVDREEFTEKDAADALLRRSINEGPIERLFMDRAFEFSNRDGSITTRPSLNRMRANQRECYVLQSSAQIFGGNSGGPLITKDGTVIGINTWSHSQRAGVTYSLTLPQLNKIVADHVSGAVWRKLAK
jgi:S1-C subfamily serine protease